MDVETTTELESAAAAAAAADPASQQTTQITSIDGFFNRKRGRPPKNRFVEVYKSAQHSPQAIFTSFKLEKHEQSTGAAATGASVELHAVRQTEQRLRVATATDLTPSRSSSRRKARAWTLEKSKAAATQPEPVQSMYSSCSPVPAATLASKCLERVSAGTFFPENASADQPQDLSMRSKQQQQEQPAATTATSTPSEPAADASLKLLQFKQLIDLYQRQVLLPSFLAAASQPAAALDMRLLLINAAAAAAVATTPMPEPPPAPISATRSSSSSNKRARDQDIPTGYLKFRFNEDCRFERCGYRNHQSHFHCNRRDCHYSFCDKTRFVQHTARHERMDTLMGEDFLQFRANMRCGKPNCSYDTPTTEDYQSTDALALLSAAPKKTSHFHCRKCDYVCTDSNKVVAHRRLHMRLEYVRSAGFRKIASNESCDSPACSYALRHTHYHCISCDCSVLSRAQLAAHRHRSHSQSQSKPPPAAESATATKAALEELG
ncbi:CG7512 [Drosophila busckii]|uniref:CG7512 n=1 Tax=Drosophila busckii TaxID=30019 RepID=A0A0M4EZB3_DROBS|nr:CG7512 [Drosophila busckii]